MCRGGYAKDSTGFSAVQDLSEAIEHEVVCKLGASAPLRVVPLVMLQERYRGQLQRSADPRKKVDSGAWLLLVEKSR